MTIVNALTVDVEEYFQIHAFSDVIHLKDWDSFESRVERNTHRILDILDSVEGKRSEVRGQRSASAKQESYKKKDKPQRDPKSSRTRATFFVLGWIAERHPALVKEIHTRGHEIACHGYDHQSIFKQTRGKFEEDVRRTKGILEDLTGVEVFGYRAPTYSITRETLWALEILIELGFRYDSSIFPIKHDFYGFPNAPRFPFYLDLREGDLFSQFKNPKYLHEMKNPTKRQSNNPKREQNSLEPCASSLAPDSLFVEFPLSTITLFGRNLPCSGGGYFRFFPYWYTKWGFKKLNTNGSQPTIFYIHPWELDPDLPKINGASGLSRFRTYVNLKEAEGKFMRLLNEFAFAPLSHLLC